MENEKKVIAFAGAVTAVALIAAVISPEEHAEYWYNFPGFETIYGVLGVLFYLLLTKFLSKFNQKEGLIDD